MYTMQMKKAVHSIKPPADFHIDILDYNHFLTIQFYESHWRHMTDSERLRCIKYMTKVKTMLESLGAQVALDPILDITHPEKG
jgi:hypothetical protein